MSSILYIRNMSSRTINCDIGYMISTVCYCIENEIDVVGCQRHHVRARPYFGGQFLCIVVIKKQDPVVGG